MAESTLEGPPIIISGAGGLLGAAFTQEILRRRGNVIALDSDSRKLSELTETVTPSARKRLRTFLVDISDEKEMQSLFRDRLGQLSPFALVNNAAINPKVEGEGLRAGSISSFSYEDFQSEMLIGLYSALSLSRFFVSYSEPGSTPARYIVNIGSDFAHLAPKQSLYQEPGVPRAHGAVKPVGYSMVKHGIHGLTKYLATYFAGQRVLVNTLSPGGVENNQPDWFLTKLKGEIPLGRMAKRGEIATVLCALLSGDFTYMTGQEIVVDGGRAIW